jgi:hypothetical protein
MLQDRYEVLIEKTKNDQAELKAEMAEIETQNLNS